MARLVLKDIEREGVLTGEALREVRGGARAATRTGGSQTDHGRVTNDPSANNPNAHDHQTDGIHDDNGRIGNNGLGRQGRSGGSTGGSAARPTGGGSTAAPRIKWNATVLLAEKPKSALPTGQKAASTVRFEETVSKYVSGNVNVEVVQAVTLTSGADSKIRDAFNFTRKGGAKGYGVEMDVGVEYTKVRGGWTTWTDAQGTRKWLEDPLALDLDGDGHISTTGVGSADSDSASNQARMARFQQTGSYYAAQGGNYNLTNTGQVAHQKGYMMDWNSDGTGYTKGGYGAAKTGTTMEAVSFATGKDAFLAIDRDGDGLITKGTELFGPKTNNGLAELAALDTNKDGKISKLDKDYSKLKLVRVESVSRETRIDYTMRYQFATQTYSFGGRTYSYSSYQSLGTTISTSVVGGAINPNNFQSQGSEYLPSTSTYGYDAATRTYTYAYSYRSIEKGFAQKVWSLEGEGVEEISLATLGRARAEFNGTGVSATTSTAGEAQARNLLREARDRTGIDMTGARVIMTREDGGAATQTTNVAQTFRAAQPATGLTTSTPTGGRGARDTTNRA